VAGTVRGLGEGVVGFGVGEPVVTLSANSGAGGYAAIFVSDAAYVASLKDVNLDPALAVAVAPNGATAYLALTQIARIRDRERVLVHGALGGLAAGFPGIARQLGASRVVGTVRASDLDACRTPLRSRRWPAVRAWPFGESRYPHGFERVVRGAQLLACLAAAELPAQPIPVQQMSAGEGEPPGQTARSGMSGTWPSRCPVRPGKSLGQAWSGRGGTGSPRVGHLHRGDAQGMSTATARSPATPAPRRRAGGSMR
jgi:hypothetical protein